MTEHIAIYAAHPPVLPAVVNHANWGSLFLETAVWEPAVRHILRTIGAAEPQHIEPGFPGSCAVFVAADRQVVKLYPPLFAGDFARETAVYMLLNGRFPQLPTLIAHGTYHDAIDWPFLVTAFRPGEPIREQFAQLDASARAAIAADLGPLIRTIHATPLTAVAVERGGFRPWPDFLAERAAAVGAELRARTQLAPAVVMALVERVRTLEPTLRAQRPCLLHADLTEDHLLLAHTDGRWQITGLIDYADAELGPPGYEWVALWFSLCNRDPAFFRATLHAYDPQLRIDDNFLDAALAFTCLHRFGAQIIESCRDHDRPHVTSLAELRAWLWPF